MPVPWRVQWWLVMVEAQALRRQALRRLYPHPRPRLHRPWRSSFNKAISKRQIPMLTILFGYSVALDGDTLVVGAPQEGSNATGVNGNQTSEQ